MIIDSVRVYQTLSHDDQGLAQLTGIDIRVDSLRNTERFQSLQREKHRMDHVKRSFQIPRKENCKFIECVIDVRNKFVKRGHFKMIEPRLV